MGRPSSGDSKSPKLKVSREKTKHKSKDKRRDKEREGKEPKDKIRDKERKVNEDFASVKIGMAFEVRIGRWPSEVVYSVLDCFFHYLNRMMIGGIRTRKVNDEKKRRTSGCLLPKLIIESQIQHRMAALVLRLETCIRSSVYVYVYDRSKSKDQDRERDRWRDRDERDREPERDKHRSKRDR